MLAILSTNNPELPPPPLTRSSTRDSISSTTSKSNRSSMIKTNARQVLLKLRLAGMFADVMIFKPPPAGPEKGNRASNRQSVIGGIGGLREKKGDEEKRRAFLVHFLQF